ncbi:MAG: hypothetical protein CMM02_03150 [Rhodopirellula sp.]|nr:hypothetical protein [Rhodopirellula sp.]|tara:strand:+ start:17461 stop:18447 length:987 start_codon:yes stop_codon:yes gene_type:complete
MSSQIKASIMILTQNTIERKVYLKTTLYFLFRNFNNKYKYPITILHEGDYKERDIKEIISGIRGDECKSLINFKELNKEDFELPSHINKEILEKSINTQIVPYWRNKKYRLMCNFWFKNFIKYCDNYDYIMRLDDDSIIEEPINTDVFKLLKENDHVYMSNIVHVDCGLCNYNMKELFSNLFPDKKDELDKLFVSANISKDHNIYNKFKELYKIINNTDYNDDNININMPIMYYNNFFVTDVNFWKRNDVKNYVSIISNNPNFYYYRYGDAPLQTILLSLLEPNKITRTVFKYSKKLQREAFIDLNNNIHSFMPNNYDNSSCVIVNKK